MAELMTLAEAADQRKLLDRGNSDNRELVLVSADPGVRLDDVRAATGWDLRTEDDGMTGPGGRSSQHSLGRSPEGSVNQ